ncbi:MAG: hypothetical protein JJU31_04915 [Wenzhouxiangella sp.]|nr:hypothetical protein [Wenzhouxiangella sp.]
MLPAGSLAADISLRDAVTGQGLHGTLTYTLLDAPVAPKAGMIERLLDASPDRQVATVQGRALIALDRPAAVRIEVPGYHPLHTVLRPSPENHGWTIMLDPIRPAPPAVAARSDRLIVSGWVTDVDQLVPIAGAKVEITGQRALALSDAGGYFELEMDMPDTVDDMPEPLSLRVSAPGFPDWVQSDLLLGPGGYSVAVFLGGPSPDSGAHRQLKRVQAWPEAEPEGHLALTRQDGPGDAPPASITVGFADAGCTALCGRPGCLNACSHSCVFSLETYVRRGLPDEWIASWNFDALAAGAVAYRSYGAWHAFNPLPEGSWDVCSNACCQVNPPGTHVNTNAAIAATPGLMLVRNGSIFRSEYSSQNNCLVGELSCTNIDLSCGDGFAGSPAANWPCLADQVGVGRSCFGHGRGMSQWGNQLWTQASPPRTWRWQLDHYYNAQGQGTGLRTATISQVLVIDAMRVLPANAGPGSTVILELDVRNLAAETHPNVLIGASLRRPPDPFIDDPANDQPVVLPPGPSTISRPFTIPTTAAPGQYNVFASLFIDVDRNQAITSTDLSQQLLVATNALTIQAPLFHDRFQGFDVGPTDH